MRMESNPADNPRGKHDNVIANIGEREVVTVRHEPIMCSKIAASSEVRAANNCKNETLFLAHVA